MPESNPSTNDVTEIEPPVRSSSFNDIEESPSANVREGLPPSYRMRADRHYIDHLESKVFSGFEWLDPTVIESTPSGDDAQLVPLVESIRRHGVLQPLLVQKRESRYRLIAGRKRHRAATLAGLRRVPCTLHDVDDEAARALGDAVDVRITAPEPAASVPILDTSSDVARSLETLSFCASLLSGAPSDLSRGVSTDLIAAEAWRTLSVVEATRISQHGPSGARKLVSPRSILGQIERGFVAECRLRNVVLEIDDRIPETTRVRANEHQLVVALAAAVNATLAVVERERATLQLSASIVGGQASFTVTQSAVAAADAWTTRAFDELWTERPGGASAAASMVALKRIAEACGGSVSVSGTRRGTAIAMTIPMA